MSEKEVYQVVDKIREEYMNMHPDWEEQIDTICSAFSYELRNMKGDR